METLGLEYRFMARHLQGKISKTEMIEGLTTAIWHYAKRQMTWLRRWPALRWVDVATFSNTQESLQSWLS
jgi:tRNA dimethylallyltransferase